MSSAYILTNGDSNNVISEPPNIEMYVSSVGSPFDMSSNIARTDSKVSVMSRAIYILISVSSKRHLCITYDKDEFKRSPHKSHNIEPKDLRR
jgi:hypothetical protein